MRKLLVAAITTFAFGAGFVLAQERSSWVAGARADRLLAEVEEQFARDARGRSAAVTESGRLRRQVSSIRALARRYAPGGFSEEELDELRARVASLRAEATPGVIANRTDQLLTLLALQS